MNLEYKYRVNNSSRFNNKRSSLDSWYIQSNELGTTKLTIKPISQLLDKNQDVKKIRIKIRRI